LNDHFFFTDAPYLECFATMASIARITNKVRLGTLVACNSYRNPAHLAKMVSTIDNISNGRVEFGIGAGWYDEEYYSYGYEFPDAKIRIRQLAEAVQVIKAMWTNDKSSLSGKYYSINDAVCNPSPIQKPYPPIWIGGSGNMLINAVAKYGDGCNFGIGPRLALTPEKYRERVSYLEGRCRAIDRDPKSVRKSFSVSLVVGKDKEDVKRGVRDAIAEISTHASARRKIITALHHPGYLLSGFLSLVGLGKPRFMIAGTAEECGDMLRQFSDFGVELFMFNMPNLRKRMHSLELLIDKVAPAVK
jgi:alkanesulfonate monooxygenase SsuD/methylene tetrahydromethanopterin reductase-like flavin-dependent oxidoreductase (luciferase family)